MSTIAQDVWIGMSITYSYRSFHDSNIPTKIGNPEDSIGWSLTVAEPIFDHSRTTLLQDSLVLRARHALTELVQVQKRPRESLDEDKLHAKLLSYLELSHDWDGRGAVPPSRDAVLDTIDFLGKRPPDISLPFPQIASDGEVGLYWRTGEIHVEIGFYGDGELSYYARHTPASGDTEECGRDGYRLSTGNWPLDLMLILNKL